MTFKMYHNRIYLIPKLMEIAKLNFQYPDFCYLNDKLNLDKRLMKHEFDEV